MEKIISVEAYIKKNDHYFDALTLLRQIVNTTGLEETIKWNAPVYSLNGKNVLGLGAFKHHCCIWFFNGVFLKDEQHVLVNAQENKTKALRQLRFKSVENIDKVLVESYVKETIENQKLGREIKPSQASKKIIPPPELDALLLSNTELKERYKALTPGKQREYCSYISEAKRAATKLSRLKKITPLILQGVGLNDKYKNC